MPAKSSLDATRLLHNRAHLLDWSPPLHRMGRIRYAHDRKPANNEQEVTSFPIQSSWRHFTQQVLPVDLGKPPCKISGAGCAGPFR